MPKQIQTLQQKQTLTMTTSMHQSLSILQMSNTDLVEFAAQELGKNPFIEDDNISVGNKEKNTQAQSKEHRNFGNNNYSSQDFLSNIASKTSLRSHITEQINLSFDNHKTKLIAFFLLDSLQTNGYLGISVEEAAKILKCKEAIILQVLQTLQKFDPVGVFARNLQECLLIQLEEQGNVDPALLTMVKNISLIATGNLKKLSKLCDINIGNISDLVKQIKLLNPKPANGFLVDETSYKIPDVILTIDDRGVAKIETNHEVMPKLKVNNDYYALVKNNISDVEEKEFTKNEIEAANSIVKSIEQRSNTILRIAAAIVESQIDFFTRGVMYLTPMTLNTIAAITGFNESTVSRATANKYISAPSGIYELKYFFSSGLSTARSAASNISSTKVKEIIKQLVLDEELDNILSDDDIVQQLSKFNVSIARRTVTKYRESLSIPSSSIRKRTKIINGK